MPIQPPSPSEFVTTSRGSSTLGMVEGVILSNPGEFGWDITYHTRFGAASHPGHRRPIPASVPHRSARLAKKALPHTPALVAAQNVLLKKLGLLVDQEITPDNLNWYIQMFKTGLSEEQAHLIIDLFVLQGQSHPCRRMMRESLAARLPPPLLGLSVTSGAQW
jgi:hypothetical protein